ncbi:alpha/beta hydrolase fold domain-containing protein, partial [Pirellulales bacterium]|nr:alpha/beta hydrolase fold domain-containing protein [Pirellulales bacterium]
TPWECVKDAKSAVRWLRVHAERFGIDETRIAVGGGSAGGHIAAAEVGQTSASFGLQKLKEVAETPEVAPSHRRQRGRACGCLDLAPRSRPRWA